MLDVNVYKYAHTYIHKHVPTPTHIHTHTDDLERVSLQSTGYAASERGGGVQHHRSLHEMHTPLGETYAWILIRTFTRVVIANENRRVCGVVEA